MLRTLLITTLFLFCATAQAQSYSDQWQQLLSEAVSDGVVDYSQWRDSAKFAQVVTLIGSADTNRMGDSEKLAFYINAYNILAAQGILRGRSPSSLLGRLRYFKTDRYLVAGAKMNLSDLENNLIRPMGDPRIHFAIVCASQSCPILRSESYTPDRLEEQLEDAARTFINDARKNRIGRPEGVASLSKIFDWFDEEFSAASGSVQKYLADYVTDPADAALLREEAFEIKHLPYDWSLNGRL